jgi:hypothetical protein
LPISIPFSTIFPRIHRKALKPGESVTKTRPSPTSNNLARQIESAVEQFDAVNSDHKLPNVLVIVNHAAGRTRSDLHVTVAGIQVPDGPRLYTLKPDRQKQVWEAARRVDLFLWIDAQNRTCQHVYPDDAVHRAAACALLGIEIRRSERATHSTVILRSALLRASRRIAAGAVACGRSFEARRRAASTSG